MTPEREARPPAGMAPSEIEAHPVFGQVRRFLGFIVGEPSEELSFMAGPNKERVCAEILADVMENVASPEPVVAVRRRLTNYADLTAQDEVLVTAPGEGSFPGITGELRARVPELARSNPVLRAFLAPRGAAPEPARMVELLRARGALFSLWMRAYNVVRIQLGDWDMDKRRDWFGPYRIAQALHREFAYRRELEMPPNLASPDALTGGIGEFMLYGEFEKVVLEGHRDPRAAWEARWESVLHYPSPLAGLEL